MASFVKLWSNKNHLLDKLIRQAREAELQCELEYQSAVRIQSWFRGCRVRKYLSYLHSNAVVIQCHYRGYRGRAIYRKSLKERLDLMRENYYQAMATRIQSYWRGYCVRKHVFNYQAYHKYMLALQQNNEVVRARLKEEWQKAESERLERIEQAEELEMENLARQQHFMLSTATRDGIFKQKDKSNAFEDRMRSIQYAPLVKQKIKQAMHEQSPKDFYPHHRHHYHLYGKFCCLHRPLDPLYSTKPVRESIDSLNASSSISSLPPLVKVQGPFKSPEAVWRLRVRPLQPTLNLATPYDSLQVARDKMKAENWRARITDKPFIPSHFYKEKEVHNRLLHSSTSYTRIPYGNKTFRDTDPKGNISQQPFRTLVSPIPLFDRLNCTF